MLQLQNKELYSFVFQEEITLASYMAKINKLELPMSALHHDGNSDREILTEQKPEMVTFNDKTKGQVVVVSNLCSNYDVIQNKSTGQQLCFTQSQTLYRINSFNSSQSK